ncbi:MAG: M1 family metallopeptidase [Nitrospirota bacterium]
MSTERPAGRLPETVTPEAYDLALDVRPEEGRFSGRVCIAVRVQSPTREIALHAQDLVVSDAALVAGERRRPLTATLDAEATRLTLTSSGTLPAGQAALELTFSGSLNRQMKGLYEARAVVDGVEERYAFTQFEPADARRCFPCFDEPAFKAAFRVQVTAPARLTVLSNMPALSETREGVRKTVRFAETPVMSTYLLAVAVGRLASKRRSVAGTDVAVWALPDDLALADFALDVTAATLPLLNDYFGLPYPYPKLDLIAVPDFAMGAMENWGAIFFRDSRLLVDPARASTATQRVVANVIVHEIVHQWFGNLVTMRWWDDLWLNEAFATWLACKIVDQWRPAWRSWEEFELEKHVPLALDALDSTRPIVAGADTPAQIEAMFDPLTYEKGAAVLRMFEQCLGPEEFREGIRAYMKRHQFGNTVAVDLWRALEAASGRPVGDLARDWLTQAGYPVVHVETVGSDRRTLELTQRRWSAHGRLRHATEQWRIPVVIRYQDASGIHAHRVVLDRDRARVTLPAHGEVAWVYGNGMESGFYRVTHDPALHAALLASGWARLDAAERVGLLNHAWAAAESGEASIAAFLDILPACRGDATRVLVESLAGYLDVLLTRVVARDDRPLFARTVGEWVAPLWDRLGWEARAAEDDEARLTRAAALWLTAAVAGDHRVCREANQRVDAYLADPSSLDPTLVSGVLRLGARLGDAARFDAYVARLRAARSPEERDRFLVALAEFPDRGLIRRLLELVGTDAVRGQDAWKPFRPLLENPDVQDLAWDFVKTHWGLLREKVGSVGASRVIQATRGLWRSTWRDEVATFFHRPEHRVDSAATALEQTVEFIDVGVAFKATQTAPLSRWLRTR